MSLLGPMAADSERSCAGFRAALLVFAAAEKRSVADFARAKTIKTTQGGCQTLKQTRPLSGELPPMRFNSGL